MTTTVINNVPRELLADLLGNDHDKRIMAERHLLAMLANAPSPAGVDGLVAVKVWEADADWDDHELVVRLSAAQAIIDGLRGDLGVVTKLYQESCDASYAYTQQAQRIGELEGLLREAYKYPLNHACETVDFTAQDLCERIDAALSAGKEGE